MHFRIILFSLALGQALVAHAADWPQWRGPTRDGVLPAKGLAMTTLPDQPSVLWKIKSGEGLASPVVANGSVFHFENRNGNETMVALSIADGSEQWAKELSPVFEDGQGPRGPRCTPVSITVRFSRSAAAALFTASTPNRANFNGRSTMPSWA